MKTTRLSVYIEKFQSRDAAIRVIDALESQNIRYVTFDEAIHMTHIELGHVCSRRTLNKIMRRFLDHEVRRNRITEFDKAYIIDLYGYECLGCMNNRSSQSAHMEPGGCMFDWENEFCYSNR